MPKQLAFLVDAKRCVGCFTCAMACRNFNHTEPGVPWRQVYPLHTGIYPHSDRAFYSLACNHCENPVCLQNCPTGAYTKRAKDGVVEHNADLCIGCQQCVRSCPYGAPRFNPILRKIQKCNFCAERLDAGLSPVCVQSCPTDALRMIDLESFNNTNAVHYPAGFPHNPRINPSTRFFLPTMPTEVRE